jgi:hypothetical protein
MSKSSKRIEKNYPPIDSENPEIETSIFTYKKTQLENQRAVVIQITSE